VARKTKFFSDLRKVQVLDSVNFPMMMREGDKTQKKHPTQQYEVTIRTSNG
jgi:hypothetical protein